jgi:hypothetical protein
MPISVLTQHNDNARTGGNLGETILDTSNVNVNDFGKLFSHTVQGQIYAQPLYVPFVNIPGKGVHNIIIVATMENWLYAFDADDIAGGNAQFLWGRQIHPNPIPAQVFRPTYTDVVGNIGILSTPVIDVTIGTSAANPSTGTIYLLLATWDPTQFPNLKDQVFQQLLYAIKPEDGSVRPPSVGKPNPVAIQGQAAGVGYAKAIASDLPVDTSGGSARLNQTVNHTGITLADASGGHVNFIPMQQMQRPGLLLHSGVLYIAFGSHGDFDPYHGWVFAYDAQTFQQRGAFCATPNGGRAGIWQAGEGLVADSLGTIYMGTGNGDSKTEPGGDPDLGESYVRLQLQGGSLKQTGFVTVIKNPAKPLEDEDLGAASPTLLPDGFLVGGGKDGNFYLLEPSQLNTSGSTAAIVQTFLASRGPGSRAEFPKSTHHIHGSPVVYDSPEHGVLVYVWGENDVLRAYRYDPVAHSFPGQPNQKDQPGTPIAHGVIFASNDDPDRAGMPGGMLSVSANGKTPGSAILWSSFPPFLNGNLQVVDGELVAYNASQFDDQGRMVALWRSHQNPERDDYGKLAKFCCPTIANGKVYQATFNNKLNVYGLLGAHDGGYNFAFGGRTGLTLNGSARSDQGPIRLSGHHLFQAGSVFSTNVVNVGLLHTRFRFRLNFAVADGLAFVIQSEGPRALGGPGGGLGYGPDPNDPLDPGFKITKSIAVKFDLFDNQTGQQRSLTGLYRDGNSPSGGPDTVLEPDINLHSGHVFQVNMSYDAVTLQVRILDEQTRASAAQHYAVDIPAITGASAHVGFTAATGGFTAEHDILSWQFTSP